jgi:hypothetical protein
MAVVPRFLFMNFEGIKNRVSLGVQRDDLTGYYGDFVNEAQVELQKLRDWTFCHQVLPIEMPVGANTVELFPDFKAMGDEPAVFILCPTNGQGNQPVRNPCKTMHRQSFYSKQARNVVCIPFVPPLYNRTINFPLWWAIIGGRPILGLPEGVLVSGAMTFEVAYYRYLEPLVQDSDTNEFTLHHSNMLIDMAKSIAFKSINDPLKDSSFTDAMGWFKLAAAKDDHIKLAGVSLRMGG